MTDDPQGSRVYRQFIAFEIIAIVPPTARLPHTDFEARVREAIMENADQGNAEDNGGITYCVPGHSAETSWEELTPS